MDNFKQEDDLGADINLLDDIDNLLVEDIKIEDGELAIDINIEVPDYLKDESKVFEEPKGKKMKI